MSLKISYHNRQLNSMKLIKLITRIFKFNIGVNKEEIIKETVTNKIH